MRIHLLLSAASLAVAAPALAQSTDAAPAPASALPDPNDPSDQLTVGVGGALLPDYTGSNNYRLRPAAVVRGRVSGISFSTRGTALDVNLIPRGKEKFSFAAGPVVALGLNRTGKIKDPVIALLPKRNKSIELGGFVGGSLHGLTNPYDSLGAKVTVTHDVAHAHRSTIVTPSVDFSTPLSRTTYVGLSAGLDFVSSRYAQYYFGVTPAEATLSGLPAYAPKGGLKDWKVNLLAVQSLSGNLLKGLALGGTLGYSRLQGDFKRSPLVAQRGKAGQWLAALGLAYSF
jgi:outer membrane scaffolding protein for murein synthesis (MipA/OmpV family)